MISQGIGRGELFRPCAYGEKPNVKGKPIKLSTTYFVLLFPVIRRGWGIYCMGMGRVWEKVRIGKRTHFSNRLAHEVHYCWIRVERFRTNNIEKIYGYSFRFGWTTMMSIPSPLNEGWMIKNVLQLPKMWGKMKTWMHEGGTLQWHSWLRDELLSKISISVNI